MEGTLSRLLKGPGSMRGKKLGQMLKSSANENGVTRTTAMERAEFDCMNLKWSRMFAGG